VKTNAKKSSPVHLHMKNTSEVQRLRREKSGLEGMSGGANKICKEVCKGMRGGANKIGKDKI
jgi:hypothetical protein